MKRAARALAAALLLATSARSAEPPPDKALAALFEREFQRVLEEAPEYATYLGIEGHNDRLNDLSPAAIARRKAHGDEVIAELQRFDPARLGTQDRISREIFLGRLRQQAEENKLYAGLPFGAAYGDGWLPVASVHGPQQSFNYLAQATPFRNARDYGDYLKRLDAIPVQLAQMTELMRAGMRSGWVAPRQAFERVPATFDSMTAADVTALPLWKPFASFPDAIPAPERERLAAEGRKLLENRVRPAFVEMRRFIAEEYLPRAATSLAASDLPAGAAYYALLVREQTTTDLTPAQIHEIGLAEVKRIRGEMDRVIAASGFKGSFTEFLDFLRTDPRFYFKTPEARLMAYRDIAKRADAELPKLFAELPRVPYGVRAMDPAEGDNADHYSPPALDGSRAGFFDANVNNLPNRPSWEMESTLLHEAVPGHHLQNARALELAGLPKFRRSAWYVAYGEGWALYAESLGYEMGFYKDPYNAFGRLSNEMLRACRLVIDTGIHAFGWGREQAIRYLTDNSGYNTAAAAAEIDRYIVWPGQALGYKVGELRIKALRARAATALGSRFDLRRFHNAILDDGPLPLTLLEARIDEWVAKQKTSQ